MTNSPTTLGTSTVAPVILGGGAPLFTRPIVGACIRSAGRLGWFLLAVAVLGLVGCAGERASTGGEAVAAGVPLPEALVTSLLDRYRVPGVSIAVVHDGRVDWSKGYGVRERGRPDPVDTTTLFQAASISKPVSTAVALRMVAEGRLSLDEDVDRRLVSWRVPDNPFTATRPLTLRMLLSHSAGLTMHGVPEFVAGAPIPTLPQILDGDWAGATDSVRVVREPGTAFGYSGGGYIVVELLLTDVAQRPFTELAEDLVLRPAGMRSSTFEQPLPGRLWDRAAVGHGVDGAPLVGRWHTLPERAAGGLWTTPTDLARFLLEIWRSYQGLPDALLPQSLAREMLTRQIDDFGLGFSLPSAGVSRFQHSGGNGGYRCMMVLSVGGADGVVIMSNGERGEPLIQELFRTIGEAYGWIV